MKHYDRIILLTALVWVALAANASAYIVTDFSRLNYLGGSASDLERMEATFGISGMVIEDFADSTINERLSITGAGSHGWVLTSPPHQQWGATGTGAFRNYTQETIINISGGTSILGLGFSALETSSQLLINGEAYGGFKGFSNFHYSTKIRNGYLKIEAEPGDETITSISFRTSKRDGYDIDYIAFDSHPVPIPSSLLLIGCGLVGLAGSRRTMGV